MCFLKMPVKSLHMPMHLLVVICFFKRRAASSACSEVVLCVSKCSALLEMDGNAHARGLTGPAAQPAVFGMQGHTAAPS